MAGELSGVSRNAWDHTVTYWRGLLQVSIVPFVLIIASGSLYLSTIDLDTLLVPADEATVSAGQLLSNLVLSALNLALWSWLVVKILRFRLVDEATSMIGAPGTLRCAGRMFAYTLGAFGLSLGALIVLSIVLYAIIAVTGSAALYYLLLLASIIVIGWGLCRLFVGFIPIAIGEGPGFFSGWQLTESTHIALFGRVMAVMAIIGVALFVSIMVMVWVFGDDIAAYVQELEAGTRSPSLSFLLFFNFFSQAASLVCYWFFVSLFAEVYLRLSRRTPPLQTV